MQAHRGERFRYFQLKAPTASWKLIQFLAGRGTKQPETEKNNASSQKQVQKVRLDLSQNDQIKIIWEILCNYKDTFGIKRCKTWETTFKSPVKLGSVYYFFPAKAKKAKRELLPKSHHH